MEKDYSIGDRYSSIGNYSNGTNRDAISTYVRFFQNNGSKYNNMEKENFEDFDIDVNTEFTEDNEMTNDVNNFTYERDLKNSLIKQSLELFPNYNIYGNNNEGIEYSIQGKRIDLLLENKNEKILLAIELKQVLQNLMFLDR
jgi:hypothetical protein